jgi:uncharacterized Ntn-hydrolase superfamily protein
VTFSIVARSVDGSHLGVAVASKFVAVGAVVPAASAGVGALATQAWANLAYRPNGLALLRAGQGAEATLAALVSGDDGRAERQAGIVDAAGHSATYTGDGCTPWAGGRTGHGYAIQGNILTGPEVVDVMEAAWLATDQDAPLAERLLSTLLIGDRAGGDSRGRQSAAVLVVTPGGGYGGGSDVLVDLRVDDHLDPVPELIRILGVHTMLFGSTDAADCLPLEGELAQEVGRRLAAAGHQRDTLAASLASWAGVENLEERLRPGLVDPVVLDHLRATTTDGTT